MIAELQAQFPFVSINEIKTRLRHFMDSGLLIMSRKPLSELQSMTFSTGAHADQFAAKGALSAKVSVHNRHLHIVNTHLQAWNSSRAKNARKGQLFELNTWMRNMRVPDTIQLLIGDLNMDFHFDKEIFDACRILEMNLSPLVGDRQYSHQMKKWLDYALVWNGNASVKVNSEILELPKTPDGINVSDHHPIVTIVDFSAI